MSVSESRRPSNKLTASALILSHGNVEHKSEDRSRRLLLLSLTAPAAS